MARNNWNKVFDFIAFIGLCIIAVVLVLHKIISANEVTKALGIIGECIAYFVTAVSAFFYVRSKRNVWWYVAYAVALVLIIVFVIFKA
ncbi:MAG: hypothetical protein J6T74_07085 [Clostridia bacterium]|nr:hypothetical protein [Clostridia bacterium]